MTFEAQITSVVPRKLFKFLTVFILKNSFRVGICKLLAFKATFFDGSNPRISFPESLKFFNNVPSFEPISIIFDCPLR